MLVNLVYSCYTYPRLFIIVVVMGFGGLVYDIYVFISIIMLFYISHFRVLVGAFSVFGRADTGNPVQIWGYISIFVLFLGV